MVFKLFIYFEAVLLYSFNWSGTSFVGQSGLNSQRSIHLLPASWVLELKVYTITPTPVV